MTRGPAWEASDGHSLPLDLGRARTPSSDRHRNTARRHSWCCCRPGWCAWPGSPGPHRLVVGIPVAGRVGPAFRGRRRHIHEYGARGGRHRSGRRPVQPDRRCASPGPRRSGTRCLPLRRHRGAPRRNRGTPPIDFVRIGFGLQRARASLLGLAQALSRGAVDFGGLRATPHELPNQEAAFDVSLELYEFGRAFRGHIKARRIGSR